MMKHSIRPLITIAISALVFFLPREARAADWLIDPSPFRAIIATNSAGDVSIENGLVRRVFKLSPNAATVALDNLTTGEPVLRAVKPEAQISLDGKKFDVGGLDGQPVQNYLTPAWLDKMKANPSAFHFAGLKVGKTEARFGWRQRKEWLSRDTPWPAPGVALTLLFDPPANASSVKIEVHYELYDGMPVMTKWLVVRNTGGKSVLLDSMIVEQLACVEDESIVDGSGTNFRGSLRALDAFSDYSFGGMMSATADAPAVHWTNDPSYETQVNYNLDTPCLLQCSPTIGPNAEIKPGESFDSFRIFELVHDNTDRERRGLAFRHAYRALAPWTQENPILMHVRSAEPDAVKTAIDQCADVGFEMVILTFGSGFDIENESPEYLAGIKALADYGHSKGIALGGYSLLASRSIDEANDAINPATGKPGGMRFGSSPCLGSVWGENYFRKLRQFYEKTGCEVLENDGSYPGDICASTVHPGHKGLLDSQWKQWKIITDFYEWCRARGIYLNVPDWYFMAGSSKTGMGYRESNWSLPREQQEIIERQNIFDGTWEKAPSMGWMFVPLTEYHGGGAAATIEPLKDHLEHYETRLANLFGAGVQACYRGPRLFDTDETKAVVKKWVDFYKAHRAILDSDLIHLRRADGRDWDGWLHVNPSLKERGLAMIYNPLNESIQRTIKLPLYYTGLSDRAVIGWPDGHSETVAMARDYSAETMVNVPARGRIWMTVTAPPAN
ncbi:MAG TPA: hypothetical protein VHZ30_03945 [Verrucomicrobiae bacterium]|nr:hypothetical protein [Verrucomicrobiae bacterium]